MLHGTKEVLMALSNEIDNALKRYPAGYESTQVTERKIIGKTEPEEGIKNEGLVLIMYTGQP